MRIMSAAAIDALAQGQAIEAGAVEIGCVPPVRLWGGYGPITLGGSVVTGIGDRGLVSVSSGALGDSEQNVTLSLSGIEPDVLALFDASQVQRAPVAIWRLIFDGTGTILLDAQVYTRGRIDATPIMEVVGGLSEIRASVETAARGLGRAGQRMHSDADQRMIDPNDGGFRAISFAGEKLLYWGGKPPATANAAIGGDYGGGGGGGFDLRLNLQ